MSYTHVSHQFGQVEATNFVLILDDAELDTLDVLADDDLILFNDVDDSPLSMPCHKNDITFDFYAPVLAYIPSVSDKPFAYANFEECLAGILEDFPEALPIFNEESIELWDHTFDENGQLVHNLVATIENDLVAD